MHDLCLEVLTMQCGRVTTIIVAQLAQYVQLLTSFAMTWFGPIIESIILQKQDTVI